MYMSTVAEIHVFDRQLDEMFLQIINHSQPLGDITHDHAKHVSCKVFVFCSL